MPQERTIRSIAKLVGQLVVMLAVVMLTCWLVRAVAGDSPGLYSPRRLLVSVFLLLLGASLWLQHAGGRALNEARVAAGIALVLAILDLGHYLEHINYGAPSFTVWRFATGGIGLHIAVGGILAALSLLFLFPIRASLPRAGVSRIGYVVSVLALFSLFCQWTNTRSDDTGADFIGRDAMAACATSGLLLISFGILCTRPKSMLPSMLLAPSSRGTLTRRTLSVILIAPSVISLGFLILEQSNIVTFSPGAAVLTTVYVLVGLVVALFSVETLLELGKQRKTMEDSREAFTLRLQEQAAALQETVAQRTLELGQANEELATVNNRMKLALRSYNFGVWELDIANMRLVWDDRMIEVHGVTRASLTGSRTDWTGRIHPEDVERAMATSNHVIAGHADSFDTVYRIIRPDGAIRFVETHGILKRDDSGRPARLVGLVRDVTAEEALQEALNVAEERWKLAIEGANDAVWDWNIRTGVIYHDESWTGLLGYTPEEIESSLDGWRRLVHPEDLPGADHAILQHMEQRSPYYQIEYRMLAKTGEWRWILDRGKIVSRSADGKPLRMVGTHTGITARKNMERHLVRAEEVAEQVSRIALIAGWELDLVTGQATLTPGVNRICQMSEERRPSQEEILDLFPPEARATLEFAIEDARQKGKEFDLELPMNTFLGNHAWVRMLGRTESLDGRQVRIYGAMQDLTLRHENEVSRRQLEVQLFHAQKMETLGTLSGGIAHDFNNLLTGIIGYHELAAESVDEDHPARACLAEAKKASLRARELVEQILTFGRQSSGASLEVTEIPMVIEEARRFLRATLPSNINIVTDLGQNLPQVKADSSQIHQVLLNLGSNAAHAMRPHGGTLTVSLHQVQLNLGASKVLGGVPAGDYLRLSVGDTGHGMDEATMHRIFEPFFTTKSTREGSGLGLSVVHGIVRSHRGAITVESKLGKGATFHLFLPAEVEKRSDMTVDIERAPDGRGQHLVIVDDEDMVVRSAKLALEKKGYRVTMFSAAETCLEHLRATGMRPEALITDQTMPGMQGTELVAAARALIPELPVIIMSGYFTNINSRSLNELGPVILLAKPFTSNELAVAVDEALNPAPAA